MIRREEVLDMIRYSCEQILKSIRTGCRVPEDKRALRVSEWW